MKRTTGPARRTGINPPLINITQTAFPVKAHFLPHTTLSNETIKLRMVMNEEKTLTEYTKSMEDTRIQIFYSSVPPKLSTGQQPP